MPFSGEQRQTLLGVARSAIHGTLSGNTPCVPDLSTGNVELTRPAGCFVSLHSIETRRLRGCVGRLESRDPLLLAVHESSVNVLSDPRFTLDPVKLEQLRELDLELTVLSVLRAASGCLDFDPQSQGIFLTVGGRGGCFLPQVARETGWGREQLLDRLCTEKLGVAAKAWQQPPAKLFTFTVEIIGPEPFVEQSLRREG